MSDQKHYGYEDLGEKMHAKVFEVMQQIWATKHKWHAPSTCPAATKKCDTCTHRSNLDGVEKKHCARERREVLQGIGCNEYDARRCDRCKDVMESFEHLSDENRELCVMYPKAFFEVLRDEKLTIIPEELFQELKP